MSKIRKNYGWLNTRPNSSKTLLERAKREAPGFAGHIRKFEEQITIKSYSPSTVFSYSRCIAQISGPAKAGINRERRTGSDYFRISRLLDCSKCKLSGNQQSLA